MNTKTLFSIAAPLPLDDQANREKWILLAPLGDHPHEQGIQRVDAESLTRMVRSFHSLLGRLKRAFVGRAVYLGHPPIRPSWPAATPITASMGSSVDCRHGTRDSSPASP